MEITDKKPYIVKGLAWGLFSGTATAAAFLLPAFIMGTLLFGKNYTTELPEWIVHVTIIAIVGFAVYHSIYRIIASNHDLKLLSTLLKYLIVFIIITILFAL